MAALHTIVDHLAAWVEHAPNAIAVIADGQPITYQMLDARSNQLANVLRARDTGPGTAVGVSMAYSLDVVVGLLAILKTGAAYVPLEPSYPVERLHYMMTDAGVDTLLTQEALSGRLARTRVELCVDSTSVRDQIVDMDDTFVGDNCTPESIAYITYTSGSTGNPKGVPMPHRGICHSWRWLQRLFSYQPDDRVLLKSPLGFDVSSRWELLWPLMSGACVVVSRPGGHLDSAYIAQTIFEHKITVMHFVPSMLRVLLQQGEHSLTSLRRVFSGGEVLTSELQRDLLSRIPNCQLVDIYGATETIVVTYRDCRANAPAAPRSIGRPVEGLPVYVLDPQMRPVARGDVGELYVGGDFLAAGYLGQPEATAAAYVPIPDWLTAASGVCAHDLNDASLAHDNQTLLFKTGDMARQHTNGDIEHHGRLDHQVKIRGVRVELGEIETVLRASPLLHAAAVVALADPDGDKLVAYVTLVSPSEDRAGEPLSVTLRRYLQSRLPAPMIPALFVTVETLPMNRNGKIDRRELASRALPARVPTRTSAPARTPIEARLVALWETILDVERPGIRTDFFELGGDSLLAMRFLVHVRHEFSVSLDMPMFLQAPTIEAVARIVSSPASTASFLERVQSVAALQADVALDPDVQPGRRPVTTNRAMPAHVLMTGATGFLGAFLLDALLRRPTVEVHCLVRGCSTADEARNRIAATLSRYALGTENLSRVHPVMGDLSQPDLGLGAAEMARLSTEMHSIYHAGAFVNEVYPYAALRDVNVRGTHELLKLACQSARIPLHFVSSTAVFESSGYLEAASIGEHDSLDACGHVYTGYGQSKWVAEKLVEIASDRGLAANIYRPGTIAGHSRTGAYDNTQTLGRLLRGFVRQRSVPDLDITFSMMPVDYVSEAIVELSLQDGTPGHPYHLVHPNPVHLDRLVALFNALGYAIEKRPYAQWLDEVTRAVIADPQHPLAVILPLISASIPGTDRSALELNNLTARISSAATVRQLGPSVVCPDIDRDIIDRYLSSGTSGEYRYA